MGHRRPLFRLFLSFKTNITILQQIYVKNVYPVYSTGIRTRDRQQLVSSDNHQTRVPKNYEEPVWLQPNGLYILISQPEWALILQ